MGFIFEDVQTIPSESECGLLDMVPLECSTRGDYLLPLRAADLMRGAGSVLAVVHCGREMSLHGVDSLVKAIQKVLSPEANIVRQALFDERCSHPYLALCALFAFRQQTKVVERDGRADAR